MGHSLDDIKVFYHEENATVSATTKDQNLPALCLQDFFSTTFKLTNVITLDLSSSSLSEIPNRIQLPNLEHLDLSFNKFGEVPSCLYTGLANLKSMNLSNNCIKNFDVPPACYTTLEKLNLSFNKIVNLPQWILIIDCSQLFELNYSHNFITGIKTDRKLLLETLEMSNCNLLCDDYRFLTRLNRLKSLNIGNDSSTKNENRFKDSLDGLFFETKWESISILKLDNLPLSIVPHDLCNYVTLKELSLVKCDLSWLPDEIAQLKNLEILDVTGNSICSITKEVCLLNSLRILKAAYNVISVIPDLFVGLEILDLYHNNLESFPIDLNRIELIDLEYNYIKTNELNAELYFRKKDQFRHQFNLENRSDGDRCHDIIESASDASSVLSPNDTYYDSEFPDVIEDVAYETETWNDDPAIVSGFLPRHPDVTESDDEWCATEKTENLKRKKSVKIYEENEDVIFADVD